MNSMYDAIDKLKTAAAAISTARQKIELEEDDLKEVKEYMDLSTLMIYDVKKFLNNRYPYEGQLTSSLALNLRHRRSE